ncbi:hypothetical protein LIER_25923 [Lithospermum erythrorhizon]|uniref:Uncharacterized protein n=1 Tax=Lithospermum erythrorhizon TaxID=34254 RepID=A0AAV3R7V7_LITER
MIRQKEWSIKNPTTRLGYMLKPLLRLLVNRVTDHLEWSKPKPGQEPSMTHSLPMGQLCGDIRPRERLYSLDGEDLKNSTSRSNPASFHINHIGRGFHYLQKGSQSSTPLSIYRRTKESPYQRMLYVQPRG